MNPSLRCSLFTPATRPERFAKAADLGAGLLILDLEDSVAPRDKDTARVNAVAALTASPLDPSCTAVRINRLDTRDGLLDVLALLRAHAQPAFVALPKTDCAGQLRMLDRLLMEGSCRAKLIGLIESASGLADVAEISRATPRLAALMLGSADLAADLGCTEDAPNLDYARIRVVEAAAIARIGAIDSPFFDLHDEAGLTRASAQAANMGFTGKAAIHPRQIPTILAAFTPSAAAIARAHEVLAVNERGIGTIEGHMIDEAVARRARQILQR